MFTSVNFLFLIGCNCNAADLTKFIVGKKPAKMITNLHASKTSIKDGISSNKKKDETNNTKIIK